MAEFDLDGFEAWTAEKLEDEGWDSEPLHTVCQRLREAEAELDADDEWWGAKTARIDEQTKRIAALERRIAQLERVRDAAAVVVDWWYSAYQLAPEKHVVDELLAALEAVGKSKDG